MKENKKLKCYKRLIYKQVVPSLRSLSLTVSELFAETFHAPLKSFVWRRHIGAPFWYTNMAARYQQKHFLEKLFLFTRELAYVHINISCNTWSGYTTENQEESFSMRQHSYFGATHYENSKVQIAVFETCYETCYGTRNLYKDLFFVYLQPSVNKNS